MVYSESITLMVLRLILLFLLLFPTSQVLAKVSAKQVYTKAQSLFKAKKYNQAFKLLESRFNLNSKKTPLAIIILATDSSLKSGNVGYAEKLANTALNARVKWWKKYLNHPKRAEQDLSGIFEKSSKNIILILALAAESKSLLYKDFYKKLSTKDKKRLKSEIKGLYDALIQSEHDPEKTELYNNRIAEQDELQIKKIYKFRRGFLVKFLSWSDTFDYTFQNAQHSYGEALSQSLCLGGMYSYENYMFEFNLNACFGFGKSNLDLNTGFVYNVDTRALLAGTGLYYKMGHGRVDFGVDINFFMRMYSLKPMASEPEPTSFNNNTGFAVLPTIKINFDNLAVSFKAGQIIGESFVMWGIETSYKL